MSTVIYCRKDEELRKQVKEDLQLEYNHVFVSPNATDIDHSATRVIIVGNHSHIADRYKGIINAEFYQPNEQPPPFEELTVEEIKKKVSDTEDIQLLSEWLEVEESNELAKPQKKRSKLGWRSLMNLNPKTRRNNAS